MTDESVVVRDEDTDTYRDAAGAITDFPSTGGGGFVPDPSAEPDDRWLKTSSGALIYTAAPSGATFGTPAVVLGTSAAAGSVDEVIRRDSTIVAFDATDPTTQAFGDAAATGSAAVAARRDHKHAMPATPTSVSGNAGTATALQTSRNIDGQAFNGTADVTVIAPGTHAATSKVTPVDNDELPLVDSAASNVLKRLLWSNVKATLKTYFDTLYTAVGASAPPNGSAGGDLAGTYPNPTVAKIHETSGPTALTIGTVADGDYLTRSGATIVGGSPTPGGPPTGAAGGALDGSYPNPGLAAAVAGAGLAETTNVLSVNVDASTIEIATDTLRVKADGITANEIAAGAVGASELASTAVTPATYGDATHVGQFTVDADGRLTAASSVGMMMPSARISRAVAVGGDITLSGTGHTAAFFEVAAESGGPGGGGLDLTIAAATGDVLLVNGTFWFNNTTASGRLFDIGTIVSAAVVNWLGQCANGANAGLGVIGSGFAGNLTFSIQYVVQAGDLTGGNVVLRLYFRATSTTNRVMGRSVANGGLELGVVNLLH